jgi:hypothetical protein
MKPRQDDRMRGIVNVAIKLARLDRDQAINLMTSANVPTHVSVRVMAGKTTNMKWSRA